MVLPECFEVVNAPVAPTIDTLFVNKNFSWRTA